MKIIIPYQLMHAIYVDDYDDKSNTSDDIFSFIYTDLANMLFLKVIENQKHFQQHKNQVSLRCQI